MDVVFHEFGFDLLAASERRSLPQGDSSKNHFPCQFENPNSIRLNSSILSESKTLPFHRGSGKNARI
jgi:hypothetical protein